MRKLLFLVNPNAGQRRVNKSLTDIIGIFNESGYEVTVFMTNGPGSGTGIVEERAKDYDLVVCAGGDGTLNETITGVLRAGADCPVGYIPCGSTNDFASTLKLSMDTVQAAKDIMLGKPIPYDVGRWNDRYFTYIASFGAFTAASYSTSQTAKNLFGHLAYLVSGVKDIANIQPRHAVFDLPDGRRIEGDFAFGAVTNTTSAGGVLKLPSDHVSLSDGYMELFLIRMPKTPLDLQRIAAALMAQDFEGCPLIELHHIRSVRVLLDDNLSWSLDGEEALGGKRIEIKCLGGGVRLKTPKG